MLVHVFQGGSGEKGEAGDEGRQGNMVMLPF